MARPTNARTFRNIPNALLYLPLDETGAEKPPHEIAIEDYEIVRLVDGHAYRIADAAKLLGVSKSTAGRMLMRGRRALAVAIESRAPLFFDASECLRLDVPTIAAADNAKARTEPLVVAIAVSTDDRVSDLFGRSAAFDIVGPSAADVKRIRNPGAGMSRSSASSAVSILSRHGVRRVAAGRFGAVALRRLAKAKIAAKPLPGLTIEEATRVLLV